MVRALFPAQRFGQSHCPGSPRSSLAAPASRPGFHPCILQTARIGGSGCSSPSAGLLSCPCKHLPPSCLQCPRAESAAYSGFANPSLWTPLTQSDLTRTMQSRGGNMPLAIEGWSMPNERRTASGSRLCRVLGMLSKLSASIR